MPRSRSRLLAAIVGVAACALLGTSVSPAWAAAGGADEGTSPVVGGFGIGDGLEATIGERDGSVRISLPIDGVPLVWDSKAAGTDADGLGPGWSFGFTTVATRGGVEFAPTSGGRFRPDPTHPSGLAGYGVADLVFEHAPGVLTECGGPEASADDEASAEGIAYAFVTHELGGTRTYFNTDGDPVARTDAFCARETWEWDDLVPHRLTAVVDADGLRTTLDWESEPGTVVVARGLDHGDEPAPEWRIHLDGGRVSEVVDPVERRMRFDYVDGSGLVSETSSAAGARTMVSWRQGGDGVPRVDRVRTMDASGAELSVRAWRADGDGTFSSGWPVFAGERELFWSADPAFRYRTAITDGETTIISEYASSHLLVRRSVVGSSRSGTQVLQEQSFTYPGTEHGGVADPHALPGNWSRPSVTNISSHDATGATRTETESYAFDDAGRMISRIEADGTRTTSEYDPEIRPGDRLPIGLTLVERSVGTDGSTRVTTNTLNAERTAIVVAEIAIGDADTPPHPTERREFEVGADGVVTEERHYPDADASGEPRVTRWQETVDLTAGTRTRTETVGVGTAEAATTTEVRSMRHGGVIETVSAIGTTQRTVYDPVGRAITRTDMEVDAGTGAADATTTQYGYDALSRLVHSAIHEGEDADGALRRRDAYRLSAAGDITATTTTEVDTAGTSVVTEREYGYDPRGALMSITTSSTDGSAETRRQTFDAAGNLVDDGAGTTYEYDAADRLVSSRAAAATTRTEYWADGARRSLRDAGGEVTFYWDGATLTNERGADADGAEAVVSYLLGVHRHARTTTTPLDSSTSYYVADRHGSITELTDASGRAVTRHHYTDYGAPSAPDAPHPGVSLGDAAQNPFGYAGEYTDPSGAQPLGARHYDADTMRLTTMDPAPLHNPYAYADLNPVMKVDPTGNDAETDLINGVIVAAAVLSAVITVVASIASAMTTGGVSLAALGVAGAVKSIGASGALGLGGDVGGALLATFWILGNHDITIIEDERTKTTLEGVEYGMTAIGVAAALVKVIKGLVKGMSRGAQASGHYQPVANIPQKPTAPQLDKQPQRPINTLNSTPRTSSSSSSPVKLTSDSASTRKRVESLVSQTDATPDTPVQVKTPRTLEQYVADHRTSPGVMDFRPKHLQTKISALKRTQWNLQNAAEGTDLKPLRTKRQEAATELVSSNSWKLAHHATYAAEFSYPRQAYMTILIEEAEEILLDIGIKWKG